jgi:hypothetical protein
VTPEQTQTTSKKIKSFDPAMRGTDRLAERLIGFRLDVRHGAKDSFGPSFGKSSEEECDQQTDQDSGNALASGGKRPS